MTTVYNEGVWRASLTATKVTAEDPVSPVLMIPEGIVDITLYVIASAATTGKVEESYSSGVSILTGTPAPAWIAVDASLNSVGATAVRYALPHTPVALKLTSLTTDQTATMVVTGKRVYR